MLSHQSDCSGKVNVLTNNQLANFWAPKQMLLVADNVINTYNYPNLLTAICTTCPSFHSESVQALFFDESAGCM